MRMTRGTILEVRHEDDGIDLRVTAGCGRPECTSADCRDAPQCWTKIAPYNWPIVAGDRVIWRDDYLVHIVITERGAKHSPKLTRIGKYRKVRPDGTCAPAPKRCALADVWALVENPVSATQPPPFPVDPATPRDTLPGNPDTDAPQAC